MKVITNKVVACILCFLLLAQIFVFRSYSRGPNQFLLALNLRASVSSVKLARLPTHPRRILSMAIANSCVTGREIPCTKNQSKYIHDNSPGDRAYGQSTRLHMHSFNRHQKGHVSPCFFQKEGEKKVFDQLILNRVIRAHYLSKRERKEVLVLHTTSGK